MIQGHDDDSVSDLLLLSKLAAKKHLELGIANMSSDLREKSAHKICLGVPHLPNVHDVIFVVTSIEKNFIWRLQNTSQQQAHYLQALTTSVYEVTIENIWITYSW